MGWPTPQEYNEAIQNPRSAFADPELRAGQPVLTALGLPRPITGAFASVYQLACGPQRTVAVRCFLREFGDQQERYAAISAHLARVALPYMTNFTYLANGIRVNGRWHPILKMDWLEGEVLHNYVEHNLNSPQALLNLAEQWVQMVKMLRTAEIGHGDLQHGNVIVSGGQLRLIDYDGMFVPALAGRRSHELGHRNYQHPDRSEQDFSQGVDHFSTWVVYTSLVALAVQPQLWREYAGGDECLLFRREDFARPAQSPLFRSLEASADPRLASLTAVFHSLTQLPAGKVPPIDAAYQANTAAMNGSSAPRPAAADWLRDHLAPPRAQTVTVAAPRVQKAATAGGLPAGQASAAAKRTAQAAPAAAQDASVEDPSWIRDFIGVQQTQAVDFGSDIEHERKIVRLSMLVSSIAWITFSWASLTLAVPAAVTVAAAFVTLAALLQGYRLDPSVQAQAAEQRTLKEKSVLARRARKRLRRIQAKQKRSDARHAKRREGLERRQVQSQASEQAVLARHDQKLQADLAAAQRRRDQLRQSGLNAVRKLETQHAAYLADMDKQIAASRQLEEAELRQTLARRQQEFVASYMKRQTIDAAIIAGIGPAAKQALRQHGVVRAADLTAARLAQVEGVGEQKGRLLLEWRRKAEALALQAAPQDLSKIEETLIRGRFYQRRFVQEQSKGKAQRRLAKETAAVQERNAAQLQIADQEPAAIRSRSVQKRADIRKRFQSSRAQVQADLAALAKQAADRRNALDQEAAAVQQELALLQAQQATIDLRLRRFEAIEFGSYVRRVLGLT